MKKQCSRCKEAKPLTEFGKNRSRASGLEYWCKQCNNAAGKKYRDSDAGKVVMRKLARAWQRKYRKLYPEKAKARQAVTNAVRDGRLTRPETCSLCWNKGIIEGHHPDYSKPLDVEWLCKPCHKAVHEMEKTA